jgi:hypothetical protein
MGQNPLGVVYAKNPSGAFVPVLVDADGGLIVSSGADTVVSPSYVAQQEGTTVFSALKTNGNGELLVADTQGADTTTLNVSVATALATVPGVVGKVVVNAPGTGAAGGVYDTTATSLAGAANLIASLPTTNGAGSVLSLDFPFLTGLVLETATGAVYAVSYTKSPD